MKKRIFFIIIPAVLCFSGIINHDDKKELINPLIKYVKFKELKPLGNIIKPVIDGEMKDKKIKVIAVYFRSLTDGIWTGFNEKELFIPGSLLKIPVMMAYYKYAESSPAILKEKIKCTIQPSSREYSPPEMKLNEYYTVEQLIGFMIRNSDNVSMKLLLETGPEIIHKTFADLAIPLIENPYIDNYSIKDVARLFRILYNCSYLNKKMSQKALSHLTQTIFFEGLRAGVPSQVTVAHKYGVRLIEDKKILEFHDCGIIYHKSNPYLLCVLTKGKYDNDAPSIFLNKLKNIAKTVSQIVYKEVERQYSEPDNKYIFQD